MPSILKRKKPIYKSLAGFTIYSVGNSIKQVEKVLDKIRNHKDVLMGTHVYYANQDKDPMVPNGYIHVSFDVKAKQKDRQLLLKKLSLKKDMIINEHQLIVQTTKASANPFKTCYLLEASGLVTQAIPDFDIPIQLHEFTLPTTPMLPLLWHLENKGAAPGEPNGKIVKGADLKVIQAWERLGNKGSNKIRIAIIDTGFQLDHPTYIDRIKGSMSVYLPEWESTVQGHGTSCASLAVASESSDGMIGVAPQSELFLIEAVSFEADTHRRALRFCIENEVDIISCSWGHQSQNYRSIFHDVVWENFLKNGRNGKGGIVLFSAGNENSEKVNVYGTLPGIICVGGTTSADEHWFQSNRGKEVFVSAPAGDWSLIAANANFKAPRWDDFVSRGPSNEYSHFAGTSASAPLVAGVCALILSANPNLTGTEVKDVLRRTADKVGNPNGYDDDGHSVRFGYGRANADSAVKEALRLKSPDTQLPDLNEAGGNGLYHFQVKPMPSKGWGIQTGALNEYGNVLRMVDKLQKEFGSRVLIHIHELHGVPNYRVILGTFDTKQKARIFQKKVKEVGIESFLTDLKHMK